MSLALLAGIHAADEVHWGAVGHRDQGGVYGGDIQQQITDLKYVFGNEPDTIIYKAIGDNQTALQCEADAVSLRNAGIIPQALVAAYPPFADLATRDDGFNYGYSIVRPYALATPHVMIYEIGNEWTIHGVSVTSGDHTDPITYRNNSLKYQAALGIIAGAVTAIKEVSTAATIGGATNGWTEIGFPIAAGIDLKLQNLSPTYLNLHWYNDSNGASRFGNPNYRFGGLGGGNIFQRFAETGLKIAVSEFGSNGGYATDGENLVELMDVFDSHWNQVKLGLVYQLYPNAGQGYQLFSSPGHISTCGRVVKLWVDSHRAPTAWEA